MTTQEKKNRTQGKKKFPKRGEICVSTKNEKKRERERDKQQLLKGRHMKGIYFACLLALVHIFL